MVIMTIENYPQPPARAGLFRLTNAVSFVSFFRP